MSIDTDHFVQVVEMMVVVVVGPEVGVVRPQTSLVLLYSGDDLTAAVSLSVRSLMRVLEGS